MRTSFIHDRHNLNSPGLQNRTYNKWRIDSITDRARRLVIAPLTKYFSNTVPLHLQVESAYHKHARLRRFHNGKCFGQKTRGQMSGQLKPAWNSMTDKPHLSRSACKPALPAQARTRSSWMIPPLPH